MHQLMIPATMNKLPTVCPHWFPKRWPDAEHGRGQHVLEGRDQEQRRVLKVRGFELIRVPRFVRWWWSIPTTLELRFQQNLLMTTYHVCDLTQ